MVPIVCFKCRKVLTSASHVTRHRTSHQMELIHKRDAIEEVLEACQFPVPGTEMPAKPEKKVESPAWEMLRLLGTFAENTGAMKDRAFRDRFIKCAQDMNSAEHKP